MTEDAEAYLKNIARDIQSVKSMLAEVITYMKDAESEVPEKMRRFIMYMHDIHDVKHLYEELGIPAPDYIMREAERCDDRLRHLLQDLHADTGAFERVRQDMSKREGNRWDWDRQLMGPKHETRNGN